MYKFELQNKFKLNQLQMMQFDKYSICLRHFNNKMNLTSILEPDLIYIKHFYDSLLVSSLVRFDQINSLCDIGTGAGFPGIPLKILFPHLNLFLIESSYKKTIFLNFLVKELSLQNVYIYHQKVEKHNFRYDYLITRALGKLNVILNLIYPLLNVKGSFIVMKGPNYRQEFINDKVFDKFQLKDKHVIVLPNQLGTRVNLLFNKLI
ncbi:MAG: 16S rRNA (guanine(527)-N(7))-methyltransferase RsmG [Sweet potato little leaf phytoplasma]|uniref:16S rRNA (guanine(527)-N(7))-methyltransferase RsmG n=1 Tax=Candidatus Phytoplasma australasiaticum TaxID=2754999 RepID=UPI00210D2A7F|nr:16S rRNA (guanine(527)-N(7))-methyltransferase RsmG [Sweet potato little leaf phytoplasma]MDV3201802.1 16S rRNA (guanine(527)-N(7))-methyltransferase RsmG [Candidatus Phytoplasma australasiaticum]MDO7987036.1 16S rRNA (guanine(527)-N(7))-methyltransferase RsmG [Sweet potato little leaf phytoplasma]MDO8005271.1 16S rRNA (guanine(527)-N(7))-methyltransferase RsmG [Sweet potato little leaf phytoplasma]MDO8008630.1 16S rRNA (guanine(527)-N(7))-methyltransferase RsmG [Sweet potato little leaf phy